MCKPGAHENEGLTVLANPSIVEAHTVACQNSSVLTVLLLGRHK